MYDRIQQRYVLLLKIQMKSSSWVSVVYVMLT